MPTNIGLLVWCGSLAGLSNRWHNSRAVHLNIWLTLTYFGSNTINTCMYLNVIIHNTYIPTKYISQIWHLMMKLSMCNCRANKFLSNRAKTATIVNKICVYTVLLLSLFSLFVAIFTSEMPANRQRTTQAQTLLRLTTFFDWRSLSLSGGSLSFFFKPPNWLTNLEPILHCWRHHHQHSASCTLHRRIGYKLLSQDLSQFWYEGGKLDVLMHKYAELNWISMGRDFGWC